MKALLDPELHKKLGGTELERASAFLFGGLLACQLCLALQLPGGPRHWAVHRVLEPFKRAEWKKLNCSLPDWAKILDERRAVRRAI